MIMRFGPLQLKHIESRAFPQIPGKERQVEYVIHGKRLSQWSVLLHQDVLSVRYAPTFSICVSRCEAVSSPILGTASAAIPLFSDSSSCR